MCFGKIAIGPTAQRTGRRRNRDPGNTHLRATGLQIDTSCAMMSTFIGLACRQAEHMHVGKNPTGGIAIHEGIDIDELAIENLVRAATALNGPSDKKK